MLFDLPADHQLHLTLLLNLIAANSLLAGKETSRWIAVGLNALYIMGWPIAYILMNPKYPFVSGYFLMMMGSSLVMTGITSLHRANTERREEVTQAALKYSIREKEKSEKAYQALASTVNRRSHEERRDVGRALGALESLAGDISPENMSYYLFAQKAIRDVQLGLFNATDGLSLKDPDRQQLLQPVYPEAIQFTVDGFMPSAQLKELTLTFRSEGVLDDEQIFTSERRLNSILSNLISNAIKYTAQGSIKVVLDQTAEHFRVRVIDTGSGISEQDLPKIWEEGFRTKQAIDSQEAGEGLGLDIVKRSVEALGAQIDVTSKLGEGSTFTLLIPKKTK